MPLGTYNGSACDVTCFRAQEFEALLEELQRWRVKVLVLSRKAVGVSLNMFTPLRLGALPADASIDFLKSSAGSSTTWEINQAEELVGICGYNALAIKILAGLIKNQYCSPKVRMAKCKPFICCTSGSLKQTTATRSCGFNQETMAPLAHCVSYLSDFRQQRARCWWRHLLCTVTSHSLNT